MAKCEKDLAKFKELAAPTIIADYSEFFAAGFKVECDPETLWKRLFHPAHLGDPKGERVAASFYRQLLN